MCNRLRCEWTGFSLLVNGVKWSQYWHCIDPDRARPAVLKHASSDQSVMASDLPTRGRANLHLPPVPWQTSPVNPDSCRVWLISHVCMATGLEIKNLYSRHLDYLSRLERPRCLFLGCTWREELWGLWKDRRPEYQSARVKCQFCHSLAELASPSTSPGSEKKEELLVPEEQSYTQVRPWATQPSACLTRPGSAGAGFSFFPECLLTGQEPA